MCYLNRMMKNKNFNFSFPYKLWLISQQSTVNRKYNKQFNIFLFLSFDLSISQSLSLSLVHLMLIFFDTSLISISWYNHFNFHEIFFMFFIVRK